MLAMSSQDVQGNGDMSTAVSTPNQEESSQVLEENKDNIASGGTGEKLTAKEKILQMKAKIQAKKRKEDGAVEEEKKLEKQSQN